MSEETHNKIRFITFMIAQFADGSTELYKRPWQEIYRILQEEMKLYKRL